MLVSQRPGYKQLS